MKIVGILEKILKIHKLKKKLFCMYKMVVITVLNYTDAQIHTIAVGNK